MGSPPGDASDDDGPFDEDDPLDDADTEVGAALAAVDDGFAASVESALVGRSGVVAVGVPLGLFPAILSARSRTTGGSWRIACRPGGADALGRAFALGTAVAETTASDAIELRVHDSDRRVGERGADRILFATPERVDAVAGPTGARTLVTERGDDAVARAIDVATRRFEASTPAAVDMPSRTRLLSRARELLDDRFADDVESVLAALRYGEVGRTGTVTDQTLLVALAARHDHLFGDLRRWIGSEDEAGVGIAPGQELTADRRALVERQLIESIKVPMGPGRPRLRLRAVDEALLRARPEEVLSVLRGRFALPLDVDGRLRGGPGSQERRPVWERKR
ncbi:transcriptional regulator TbsP domain-containing protein [Halorubrum sp. DTA46]|uniref:transcriptional regulator TbsP domain-containing protein n=1 Tax=Halorubrum sp. DTA46 TaxID=3402162 RepID=UPI003AAE5532